MISRMAHYFAAFVVIILAHSIIISQVKGQCTVQSSCENRDESKSTVAELSVEACRHLSDQIQSMRELLTESVQQMRNQQDTVMRSLEVIARRSQEHDVYIKTVERNQGLCNDTSFLQTNDLNASFQQLKNQQDNVITTLNAIDRRSQEQDLYIKEVRNVRELLNTSFYQVKAYQDAADKRSQEQVQCVHELLNGSFQQMMNQQDTVLTVLQAADRRLQDQDIYVRQVQNVHILLNETFQQVKNLTASQQQTRTQHEASLRSLEAIERRLKEIDIKNQTQNSWKLAVGLPVQLEIGVDLGAGPLPTVGNWIVVMHRFDGSVNFNRNWIEYKKGFGDIGLGEFWLGNEKIHRLTNKVGFACSLHIEIQLLTSGRWFHADYSTFSIDSESSKYRLHLSGFSGNAGDSLTDATATRHWFQGGMNFTTSDADNDQSPGSNCAQIYQAGFWFNSCWVSCLTCPYGVKFAWESLKHLQTGGLLRAARMMIKIR